MAAGEESEERRGRSVPTEPGPDLAGDVVPGLVRRRVHFHNAAVQDDSATGAKA